MKWTYLKMPHRCLPEALALVEIHNNIPNSLMGMSKQYPIALNGLDHAPAIERCFEDVVMSPTVDRLVFAAHSMDFEITAEVFMPIRITRPDKSLYGMQPYEIKRLVAAHSDESTACYKDRKLKFSILCGSI